MIKSVVNLKSYLWPIDANSLTKTRLVSLHTGCTITNNGVVVFILCAGRKQLRITTLPHFPSDSSLPTSPF